MLHSNAHLNQFKRNLSTLNDFISHANPYFINYCYFFCVFFFSSIIIYSVVSYFFSTTHWNHPFELTLVLLCCRLRVSTVPCNRKMEQKKKTFVSFYYRYYFMTEFIHTHTHGHSRTKYRPHTKYSLILHYFCKKIYSKKNF